MLLAGRAVDADLSVSRTALRQSAPRFEKPDEKKMLKMKTDPNNLLKIKGKKFPKPSIRITH
jgi:hypothetical protein